MQAPPDRLRERASAPPEYTPLLRELLAARGITAEEEIERFLHPEFEAHTHDPLLLRDMEQAVARIRKAIAEHEHIAIYSDYDVDGIPGAIVLADLFAKLGYQNYSHYIPHRIQEGFGMNVESMDELAARGTALIITVDCGITDVEPVARAKALGIDVIITDHHLENHALPDACAIVNPNRQGDTYPDKNLCGAAVAFKLAQALLAVYAEKRVTAGGAHQGEALLRHLPESSADKPELRTLSAPIPEGWEKWLLDMVGLATLSDMVPLVGENRVFAYWGLVVLRKSRRPGLQQLCRKLRIDQRYLTEDDIGFMVAPRLNAASRMGEAMDALRLLATQDPVEAGVLVDHLDKINNERKGLVASMVREIRKRLQKRGEPGGVIVVGDPRWKPSLLGLAANTLAEEYACPVFLWGREDGAVIKGSCRSDGCVNVSRLMQEVKESFLEFGGHAYSGGFSLAHEQVHTLEQKLNDAYTRLNEEVIESTGHVVDRELALTDVTWDTYRVLEKLAPFGVDNRKPLFRFSKCVIQEVRQFGKGKDHLELSFEENGTTIRAIAFFTKPERYARDLSPGVAVTLLAHMECSRWGGRKELRLRIVDIA